MTYRSFSTIPSFNNNLFSDRLTHMDNLFSRLTGEQPLNNAPNYDLKQKDKENFEMTISVPGYKRDELDISVLNNQLNIIGKPQIEELNKVEEKDNIKWLHKGIKKNEFSLSFNLEHRINIKKATLNNGLLSLCFIYDIPEQEKPKKISIDIQNEANCVIEHNNQL